MPPAPTIRSATADDGEALTTLALASKAYWGYDAAFMEACRDDLTIWPELLMSCIVAEDTGQILGFASLSVRSQGVQLEHLFVAPDAMRTGIGSVLWRQIVQEAEGRGYTELFIDSDPHAEAFYRRMGAERAGTVTSSVFPDRQLPLLLFPLGTTLLRAKAK